MTDEAWIEQSLARLETLEAQKAQHEAAGGPVPPQIQEEIATLYEALESAADDDDAPQAQAPPAAAPAFAAADPFAAPAMAAPAMAPPVMAPMDEYGDDDFKPKGNGGLIAIAAVALLAAGGGGYWYMSQQAKPPPPEPVGEAKVIGASSVPEDTQEPQAAKGGSADRTPGTKIPEGSPAAKRTGNGGGGGKKRPRNTGKKKDDGRKVDVSDSRDPLAGI